MTVGVANVLPNATDHSGRRVRVTHTNGSFEDLTVVRNGGANEVETAAFFGQAVFDNVAANYTTKIIDETTLMLADPAGILAPMENQIRVYRKFDTKAETHNTIAHTDIDACEFLRPDAVVLTTGFFLPRRA